MPCCSTWYTCPPTSGRCPPTPPRPHPPQSHNFSEYQCSDAPAVMCLHALLSWYPSDSLSPTSQVHIHRNTSGLACILCVGWMMTTGGWLSGTAVVPTQHCCDVIACRGTYTTSAPLLVPLILMRPRVGSVRHTIQTACTSGG